MDVKPNASLAANSLPDRAGDMMNDREIQTPSDGAYLFDDLILLLIIAVTVIYFALLRAGSPAFDEFYHILAARRWAVDGTLAIGDGSYDRAWLFTKGIGVLFTIFEESTFIARLVPAAGAVAWLLVIFLWARLFLGRAIAWTTALLMLFSAEFLNLSVFVRFYTWHGFFVFLSFFCLTVALYVSKDRIVRTILIAGAVFALAIAFHLQQSSAIFVVGVFSWLVLAHLRAVFSAFQYIANRRAVLVSIGLCITIIAVVLVAGGVPQALWGAYTHSALWNTNDITTYHRFFQTSYPVLWGLFPIAAIAAGVYRPPFGLASVVIFSVAFLLHSFAGMREIRYLSYVFPFFYIIGAISVVLIVQWLYRSIRFFDHAYLNNNLSAFRLLGLTWICILLLTGPFIITNSPGMKNAFEIIGGMDEDFRAGTDWSQFSGKIKEAAKEVEVVIVTYSMAGFYYLGDIDYVLSRTIMLETDTREEFGRDNRIGRPVISAAESLEFIMNSYNSGLIVVDQYRWDNPIFGTDSETIKLIESNLEPMDGLNTSEVMVFKWKHDRPGTIPGNGSLKVYDPAGSIAFEDPGKLSIK